MTVVPPDVQPSLGQIALIDGVAAEHRNPAMQTHAHCKSIHNEIFIHKQVLVAQNKTTTNVYYCSGPNLRFPAYYLQKCKASDTKSSHRFPIVYSMFHYENIRC